MRVLVTGASGFLGSHIVDRCLDQGDEVQALVRPSSDLSYLRTLEKVKLVSGDLTSATALDQATRGVEVVYHSAARVTDYGSRKQFYDTNVLGTQLLMEHARRNGAQRFVYVSSPSVVTDQRDQVNIDETYPFPEQFVNLYSETKAIAEQLVLQANGSDFITCAIRPRAVWGPRDRTGWLPKIVAKLAAKRLPDLSGGKKVLASLCYCQNAADACLAAARSSSVGGKAYFVTDAEVVDVWDFCSVICEIFSVPPVERKVHPLLLSALVSIIELIWKVPLLAHNYSPPLSRYSVGLLTLSSTYDTSAAARDFGYRPAIDQETGLRRLRDWVQELGGTNAFVQYVK